MNKLLIFTLFLSYSAYSRDLSQCEIKILNQIKTELIKTGDLPDSNLIHDESEHIKYLGDGFFEVLLPVISITASRPVPRHLTWEVVIDAGCNKIETTIVDSYI